MVKIQRGQIERGGTVLVVEVCLHPDRPANESRSEKLVLIYVAKYVKQPRMVTIALELVLRDHSQLTKRLLTIF